VRASDADREQVAERLRQAAAEGRLDADELEERLETALSARTYGQLDATVFDLPTASVGHRRRTPGPVRLRPAVAVTLALAVAVMLIAAAMSAVSGHSHPDHWRGGVPVIWLLWIVIGWRFLAHRRGGVR
jgi:hypothetical protein